MTELEKAFEYVSKTAYMLWLIYGEWIDVRDLRQEGYLAVLEVKDKWHDPDGEASLKSYADKHIRGVMFNYRGNR